MSVIEHEFKPLEKHHEEFIEHATKGAHNELAAALSAAKKLQVVAAVGVGAHVEYIEPFGVAERKALSIVPTFVQPPEQRAAVTGIIGAALGYQARHAAAETYAGGPVIDYALRKAIAHAVIALEAIGGDGEIESDLDAIHSKTPSKFSSAATDLIAAGQAETVATAAGDADLGEAPDAAQAPISESPIDEHLAEPTTVVEAPAFVEAAATK